MFSSSRQRMFSIRILNKSETEKALAMTDVISAAEDVCKSFERKK